MLSSRKFRPGGTVLLKSFHSWKTLVPIAALALITSLPQLYLCYVRGAQWNGSCAYLDTDELAYAAYTNALIDGRPRRNDPYTGKDNAEFETLFSIQFFPAYAIALPARLLRLSSATTFIILIPLATIGITLTVFCLLAEITGDKRLAGVGAIGVVCLGTVAAMNPLPIMSGVQSSYGFFPLLRRYIPALPFVVLIASSLSLWRALTRNPIWALAAGLCFTVLVYSYFFCGRAPLPGS